MDTCIVPINSHSYGNDHCSNALKLTSLLSSLQIKILSFHLQYEMNNCQLCKQVLNLISGTTEAATAISFHTFDIHKDRQQTLTLQKLPKMVLITFLIFF